MDIKQIFDFFLYMSEGLVFFYYAHSFFPKKHSFPLTIISCLIGYAILFEMYMTGTVVTNIASIVIVNFFLFMFFFKSNWSGALVHTILLVLMRYFTQWIVNTVATLIMNCAYTELYKDLYVYVLLTTLNKLIYYLVCLLTVKLFAKKFPSEHSDPLFAALLVIPVTSIIVTGFMHEMAISTEVDQKLGIGCSISALFLLFANVIVFIVYEYSISNSYKLNELYSEQRKTEIDNTYMEILEKNNADLKIFTHDIKNHLELIDSFSDDERVKQYVEEMYSTIEKFSFIGMSKNKVFDIIISKYFTLCQKKQIDITFDVKTSNLSFLKDTDLSTILNNLLDNAVRAAEASTARRISLSTYTKNDMFQVVQIVNSCDFKPEFVGETLITTKGNRDNHGYGTKSVRRIVKKYKGTFEWEYNEEKHEFEALLIFNTEKIKKIK